MRIDIVRNQQLFKAFINAKTYIINHYCNLSSYYPYDIVDKFQTILNVNLIIIDSIAAYPYQYIDFTSEEQYFLFLLEWL